MVVVFLLAVFMLIVGRNHDIRAQRAPTPSTYRESLFPDTPKRAPAFKRAGPRPDSFFHQVGDFAAPLRVENNSERKNIQSMGRITPTRTRGPNHATTASESFRIILRVVIICIDMQFVFQDGRFVGMEMELFSIYWHLKWHLARNQSFIFISYKNKMAWL